MAVRSLQIRAKFITFIEIEAPKVQRCEKVIIYLIRFARGYRLQGSEIKGNLALPWNTGREV